MTAETKPCPFCGCERVQIIEGSTFKWRVAGCIECGSRASEVRIQTRPSPGNAPADENDRMQWENEAAEDAIAAWNIRYEPL